MMKNLRDGPHLRRVTPPKSFFEKPRYFFQKRSIRAACIAPLIFATFLIVVPPVVLYAYFRGEMHVSYAVLKHLITSDLHVAKMSEEENIYYTFGTHEPDYGLFDELIRLHTEHLPSINCTSDRPLNLIASNLTSLYVVSSVLPNYSVTDLSEIDCCYRPFWRTVPNFFNLNDRNLDESVTYAKECIPFSESVAIKDEFVTVTCKINDTIVYEDCHAFVPFKEEVERRCNMADDHDVSSDSDHNISVLMIGINAVSKVSLYRQMPLTSSFLLRKLNAIEMFDYRPVADNTFPNLVAALSGLSVDELKRDCWRNESEVFDKCQWIWRYFGKAGFRTAFGEDACSLGIFSNNKRGFFQPPTDYYIRPYMKTNEDKFGHRKPFNISLCVGGRMTLEVLSEYVSKFVFSMFPSKRFFSLFWETSLTHEFRSYPKHADEHYYNLFSTFYSQGVFDNTVLVFFSDHGFFGDDKPNSYQNLLGVNRPFLFLAFPDWFQEKYEYAIRNLRNNSRRLTTPFDIYETLQDLLKTFPTDKNVGLQHKELHISNLIRRGQSLFFPIPINRKCNDVEINSRVIKCYTSQNVDVKNPLAFKAALFICKKINEVLKNFENCRTLKLFRIYEATISYPLSSGLKIISEDDSLYDFDVTFQTVPGNAVFKSTVRVYEQYSELFGPVSRLNEIENQTDCVSDNRVKLFCYCG